MVKHVQLTQVEVRRFKRLDDAKFELGPVTVFCGPNNFGKTTGLQAIILWHAGLKQWLAKRGSASMATKRPGVAINRLDLVSLPVPSTRQLWARGEVRRNRDQGKENLRIEIVVDGITDGRPWRCGFEFDYPNEESIYCRPLRTGDGKASQRLEVPGDAAEVKVALLPPMSGLASAEPKWLEGKVDALIGEGRTAEVLRNLCHGLHERDKEGWAQLADTMRQMFNIELQPPKLIEARGEITMEYQDAGGCRLDLSAAGRGQQQIMLLLAYLLSNRGTVLLLDEPDAHLEILRQRETYNLISEVAARQGSQIIAASHSEVVLNEAAQRDTVVAFVGNPHRLNKSPAQLKKWLSDFPADHLYQAEITRSVLYLEGPTDLAILREFAATLRHPAGALLTRPFVHYIANDIGRARAHFHALREAYPDLRGAALFDRLEQPVDPARGEGPPILVWRRREIENYFCNRPVLLRWAAGQDKADLFAVAERAARTAAMEEAIAIEEEYRRGLGQDIWSPDIKASEEVLDRVLRRFHQKLGQFNEYGKSSFHVLARHLAVSEMDPEIGEKLDAILATLSVAG